MLNNITRQNTPFLWLIFKPFRVLFFLSLRVKKFLSLQLSLIKFKFFGRQVTFSETSKAKNRREREGFFEKYCKGEGIDIGYGGDLVSPNAIGFDLEHGDATFVRRFSKRKFDFIYSSHLLEHLREPESALKNWWKLLMPDGYLIVYVPHRDLYEQKLYLPSVFNSDHKYFYLLGAEEPPDTKDILQVIANSLSDYSLEYAKICNEGYKPNGSGQYPEGEYSIEIVVKKKLS